MTKKKDGPPKDFPLWWHEGRGLWCKKRKGIFHYFGNGTWKEALERFNKEWPFILEGKTPKQSEDEVTLRELLNQFLEAKRLKVESKELSAVAWSDYFTVGQILVDHLGAYRAVAHLEPADFARMRAKLAAKWSPKTLASFITRSKVIFNWGHKIGLLKQPVRIGIEYRPPPKKVVRQHRQAKGSRLIAAEDLRRLIEEATQPLRAIILLGINCGMGQSDIANLPIRALDLEKGWLTFPRPKTSVDRRAKLWLETIGSLKEAAAVRPAAKEKADAALFFITHKGNRWVTFNSRGLDRRGVGKDAINLEFGKLLKRLNISIVGRFYSLRHTFRTVAGACRDLEALARVMGHETGHIADSYIESVDDERLEAVAATVHKWLWPEGEPTANK